MAGALAQPVFMFYSWWGHTGAESRGLALVEARPGACRTGLPQKGGGGRSRALPAGRSLTKSALQRRECSSLAHLPGGSRHLVLYGCGVCVCLPFLQD